MALVDYASDSDSDQEDNNESAAAAAAASDGAPGPPPAKKPKLDDHHSDVVKKERDRDLPPPLPAAFHDLYASTVRTSTADDPSLHQGRVRQIPHKTGNWPSHLYIEWHPPKQTFSLLTELVSALTLEQKKKKTTTGTGTGDVTITSSLTSDLGAPLPLHISLSRTLSLTTADKDDFLNQLVASIRGSNIRPFTLAIRAVDWHRTEESGRSFLVLRLVRPSSSSACAAAGPESSEEDETTINKNPELTDLLKRCNQVARDYRQPGLYEYPSAGDVGNAFHISIAWSFSPPSDQLKQVTAEVFSRAFGSSSLSSAEAAKKTNTTTTVVNGTREREDIKVHVDAIKAKIGNVVTNIPLPQPGDRLKAKAALHPLLGLT